MRRILLLIGAGLWCAMLFSLGTRVAARPATVPVDLPQIRSALAAPDSLAQVAVLTPLLLAMGPDQVDGVARVFEASFRSGGGGGLPLELFVERHAALDPLLTLDRVLGWPLERRREALPTLLRSWARIDPRTALEVLNEISDPKIQNAAFPALIEGWVESGHIAGVWRYLAELESDRERERGSQVVLYHLVSREGAEATLREIEALPVESPRGAAFKRRVLRTAVGLVARIEPERAISLVEAYPEGADRDSLVRRVAVNWVTQDGPAAMAWLRTQPPKPQRGPVMREVYRRWVIRDRPAALAWMADQADLGALSPILDMYATALTRSDPDAAIAWALVIEDASLRREVLLDVAEVWQHADPEAAGPRIRELGLDDELEGRIERRRKRGRGKGRAAQPAADPSADG